MSLKETFKKSLESVGGQLKTARNYTEVVAAIREVCRFKKVKSIVVAQGSLASRLDLKSALTQNGLLVRNTSELSGDDALRAIEGADLGVTEALAGVAETGSVVIATRSDIERLVSALPPIHLVVLEEAQLVDSLEAVAELASRTIPPRDRYTLSFITGPSSTADIEEKLVRGVHGPHSVIVILLEGASSA